MTVLEVFRKITDKLFVLQRFMFTKEQQDDINFIIERIIDLEKADKAICDIECIIARCNGLI